jgi:hypothetical protein
MDRRTGTDPEGQLDRRRRQLIVGAGTAIVLVAATAAVLLVRHSPSGPSRLVGARGLALVVPADWNVRADRGGCPPTTPETVEIILPLLDDAAAGSCEVPGGASWPAADTVTATIEVRSSGCRLAHTRPSGTIAGMPYYLLDGRQLGPGVARRLVVPEAGVDFFVGAVTAQKADALLATIRSVPIGTRLR